MLYLHIITPSYQSSKTITDTLRSVSNQRQKESQALIVKHWIIDGLSKDDTIPLVQAHIKRTQEENREGLVTYSCDFISEKDAGIYDAMNKGILKADQGMIAILNSDDFYAHDMVLSKVADAFTADQTLSLVYADLVYVDEENTDQIKRFYSSAHFKPWKLRFGWMVAHPTTFIKKECYDRIGLYDTQFRIAADFEWLCRAYLSGIKACYLPEIFVRMREGGVSNQSFKNRLKANQEIVKACLKNGLYTNLALVLTKLPFKLLEYLTLSKIKQ
jgi:glycosyltransferase involved in cell wall biosynthesis